MLGVKVHLASRATSIACKIGTQRSALTPLSVESEGRSGEKKTRRVLARGSRRLGRSDCSSDERDTLASLGRPLSALRITREGSAFGARYGSCSPGSSVTTSSSPFDRADEAHYTTQDLPELRVDTAQINAVFVVSSRDRALGDDTTTIIVRELGR
ncbi:hypothetical protein NM688_g7708 [Phlebia brevispora]|uniref:Uncharacterized protein n=1 Tax=Phlebia brevispora TaxID=194682 RepID=A0ACC1S1Y4_9APHY|nr:hypothetical protein NM688_g7708 [Phlebia brevispora]